jgi:GT2 family glycosyltransferase
MTDFDHAETREVDWVSGCCMMIRREAFFKAGLFDEHYFLFNEDVDLCQAMHRLGYSVVYHPASKVVHRISSSNHRVPFKVILQRHYGMGHYHRKHIPAHPLTRLLWDTMIALRCCLHMLLNLFR